MSDWERIVTDLHGAVDDVDRAVAAFQALNETADISWLPRLHCLLAEGRDFFVREAAAVPIARLEGLRALPQLLHALHIGLEEGHDHDGLVSTVTDLVSAKPAQAAPILLEMIRDPLDWRRANAAWLWGYAAETIAVEPLLAALNDPVHCVRSEAAGALSSFEDREEVFSALCHATRDTNKEVRNSAVSALGYYGDQRAVPLLKKLRRDWTTQVRSTAKYALRQLREQR